MPKDIEAGEFIPTPAKDQNSARLHSRRTKEGSPSQRRRSMSASLSPSPPRSRAGRSPDRETPRAGDGDGRDETGGTIFVGNLNHETTERRLRDYFETYGRVLSTKVIYLICVEKDVCFPVTCAPLFCLRSCSHLSEFIDHNHLNFELFSGGIQSRDRPLQGLWFCQV